MGVRTASGKLLRKSNPDRAVLRTKVALNGPAPAQCDIGGVAVPDSGVEDDHRVRHSLALDRGTSRACHDMQFPCMRVGLSIPSRRVFLFELSAGSDVKFSAKGRNTSMDHFRTSCYPRRPLWFLGRGKDVGKMSHSSYSLSPPAIPECAWGVTKLTRGRIPARTQRQSSRASRETPAH